MLGPTVGCHVTDDGNDDNDDDVKNQELIEKNIV